MRLVEIKNFLERQWQFYIRCRGDYIEHLRFLGMRVGQNCKIHKVNFGSEPWLIKIGDNTTISDNVHLITHDGSTRLFRREYPQLNQRFGNLYGTIVIGDNCFIGVGSIILPGVKIGQDCIIGAGSVVTRDIPPRSVAFGNPAHVHISLDGFIEKHLATYLPVEATTYKGLRNELIAKLWKRNP